MDNVVKSHSKEGLISFPFVDFGLGFWVWNLDRKNVTYSTAWMELRGLAKDEIGDSISETFIGVSAESRAALEACRQQLVDGLTRCFSLEFQIHKPDGTVVCVEERAIAEWDDNGNVVCIVGCEMDITDRREAEIANDVLAKATTTKDQFLANMSHELRTPLSAILALTEGLQKGVFGETNQQQADSLRVVEQNSLHLLELINEILDWAKIDSGQLHLRKSPVNVFDLCRTCLEAIAEQAAEKSIEIIQNLQPDLPAFFGDQDRLKQVLLFLLTNAIKFTNQNGAVTLVAKILQQQSEDSGAKFLQISVRDTGIGIASDQIEDLSLIHI